MRSLTSIASDLRQGNQTPLQLLAECLERIDALEGQVRAWVFVDREAAQAAAEQAGREIAAGLWRGPLHGIPIGIKDIIDVAEWPTAAGSKRWQHAIARRDATVVSRLRDAGAVLLGKTVTTAFASFDPPPTRNPWHRQHTPGGSSSGSAAAVACGMCCAALATQTGGSITRPAAFCGVAAIKPTYGRVSLDGIVPLAESMDHCGVMARCVADLAQVLEVIAGPDPRDPHTLLLGREPLTLRADLALAEVRFGRVRGGWDPQMSAEMRNAFDRALAQLSAHAIVDDAALPSAFAEVSERHGVIMRVEAAAFHEARFRRYREDYPTKIAALITAGLETPATEYARAKEHQRRLRREIANTFVQSDVLILPAALGPAPRADSTGDPVFNTPASYLGLPCVNFPIAWTAEGLPLGIQLIGTHGSERSLLSIAARCESLLAEYRDVPLDPPG